MKRNTDKTRVAREALFAAGMFAAGAVAALVAANPAGAASTLAAVRATVVCTTTGSTPCVGWANTSSGIAVLGTSVSGAAVRGASTKNSGVLGSSTNGYGVLGQTYQGPAGVTGTSPSAEGVYGYTSSSSGGIGVVGKSANGFGVYGGTTTGDGFGVLGIMSGGGTGLYGSSGTGYGIQASSGGYAGSLNAFGTGTGLYVGAGSGIGINTNNNSMTNPTVLVKSLNSNAGDFSGKYIGIVSRAPVKGYPLLATDPTGATNLFYVDGSGNVTYAGGLFSTKKGSNGATVSAYTATSTEPTVEDTGSAQLLNGAATVRLDPVFANSIDAGTTYHVFLTPGGDTRGLYVTQKSPRGFVVRESQSGRSTVSFDYRIVATSLGQTGRRMRAVDAVPLREPNGRAPIVPTQPQVVRPAVPPAFR
jgi:hypothetical protein